jgi:uncharacterized membrane protein YfcA
MEGIMVGTALGFLSGLGVGGGSLLILWLTLVLGTEPAAARVINLLFFLPAAAIACRFRWKQGVLPLKTVLPASLAGALGAVMGIWISERMDSTMLKTAFGILLMVTGIRELCYRQRK